MTLSKDATLENFQSSAHDSSSSGLEDNTQQIHDQGRMSIVPVNKISSRPSLGSFASLNNLLSRPSKNNLSHAKAVNKKNSSWEIASESKPAIQSILNPHTSTAVKALNISQDSYLAVAGHSAKISNKISSFGGITLKEGGDWSTSKRPVMTISSGEMRRDTDVADTQGNKSFKRDRERKPIFHPMKETQEPRTLQCYFDEMLTSLGYSTKTFCALETGYHGKPTPLQKASYGLHLVRAIRSSDDSFISKFLRCGVSPNPCNMFGESIIHMACRRGNYQLLKTFSDGGCSVQVSDDFGRTPLHDACWTSEPCFKSIELVLDKDIRLFNILDCRGFTPLNYVKKENWSKWIEFFNTKKHIYWALRNIDELGEQKPPPLTIVKPNMNPVEDPANATTVKIATMLASGVISPDEILKRQSSSDRNPSSSHPASPLVCA